MFKGTIKDVITNIFAFISGIIGLIQAVSMVYQTWIATASSTPTTAEWIQLVILVAIAVTSYYTGKTGDGKAKVE
jgi:uncharacterized membrane protein